MPRKIDTAVIEYVPDFSSLVRDTQRVLGRVFNDVERVAEKSTEGVERSFEDMEREIDEVWDDLARSAEMNLDEIPIIAERAADEVGDDFQRGGERAEDAFKELRRTANRQLDAVERDARRTAQSTGRAFSVMGLAGGAALAGIGVAAVAGLGALATFGLTTAAQLEQVQISFNALLGSAEEGQRVFRELQSFAAKTPFEFPEVADAAKRFLAFNESVGLSDSQLQQFLTTVGDVASLTGAGAEGMQRVAFAFGQIGSRGKVALEEINQISEAIPGFSALGAIAQQLGVSTSEAMDMISAGSVDAATGVQAILAGMAQFPGAAGAMQMQAETLMGVFSTFKDTVSQALADSFAPVIPEIKASLTEATPVINDALRGLAPMLGGVVATLLTTVADLVKAITPILTPLVTGIGEAFAALGPTLQPLGQALGVVAEALRPVLKFAGELLAVIAGALAPVIVALAPVIANLGSALTTLLTPLLPVITRLGTLLGTLLAPFVKLIAEVFAELAPPLSKIIIALADLLMPIVEALVPIIGALVEAFIPIVPLIAGLLVPLIDIVKAFMPLVDVIVALLPIATAILVPLTQLLAIVIGLLASEAIVPLIELLAQALTLVLSPLELLVPLINEFVSWLKSIDWGAVGSAIGHAFAVAWRAVVNFFQGIARFFADLPNRARAHFQMMVNAVVDRVNAVISFIRSVPGMILGAIGDLSGLLWRQGQRIIQGLIDGIRSRIQSVRNLLGELTNLIPSWKGPEERDRRLLFDTGQVIIDGLRRGMVSALPSLRDVLAGDVTSTAVLTGADAGLALVGGGSTTNVSLPSIVVNVNGATSPSEARQMGREAGVGLLEALRRRGIVTAVRTA